MDEPDVRKVVDELLTAWESGARQPRQVFEDARALWLSRRWPQAHEEGFDVASTDVLFMLAMARDGGLIDIDIPVLRDYASAEDRGSIERAQDQLYTHLQATSGEREAMQDRDDYYGPRAADDGDEQWDFTISDPEGRRLHRAMRLDPEAGWEDLRAGLCAEGPWDQGSSWISSKTSCSRTPSSSSTGWNASPRTARRHARPSRTHTSAVSPRRRRWSGSGACRNGSEATR